MLLVAMYTRYVCLILTGQNMFIKLKMTFTMQNIVINILSIGTRFHNVSEYDQEMSQSKIAN